MFIKIGHPLYLQYHYKKFSFENIYLPQHSVQDDRRTLFNFENFIGTRYVVYEQNIHPTSDVALVSFCFFHSVQYFRFRIPVMDP